MTAAIGIYLAALLITALIIAVMFVKRETVKWTDVVMTFATVIIAGWAGVQWAEMHGAGEQTNKLIAAAAQNATAAASFATSADQIKQKIDATEKDFQRIATASENSMQATKDAMGKQLIQSKNLTDQAARSATAAEDTAKTAALQVEVTGRPWVKFKPRILSVAFNSNFFRVESAVVNIEDTFENVGPTVALNVTSWEDVFPLDATFHRTAIARQKEMCDANRHLAPTGVTGYSLFPKDPFILHSIVGPPMNLVTQAVVKTSEGERVGFVLAGCVSYRAPFEAIDAPRHQTRYVYLLGRTGADGNFNTYIEPTGTITDLGVISMPDGFSAD